jgi:dipeptidyl aminopeptidase/acylaminoacyl peptidase
MTFKLKAAVSRTVLTACLALPLAATMVAATAAPSFAKAAGAVPIENWAIRNAVSTISVSPDGKHILVLRMTTKEGENVMEIFKTDDLSKPLRRLNADPMEIISARWISDDLIFGQAWQVKRKRVRGPEQDVRSYKSFGYSLETNKFSEISGNFNIVNVLPKEPDTVLVATSTGNDGGAGVDPFAAFRPRSYYRFNLEKGTKNLVLKGNQKFPSATFDNEGNPRLTGGRDGNSLTYYYRQPGDGEWTKFGESYDLDDANNLYRVLGGLHGPVGMKDGDDRTAYFIDNRGGDKAGLWEVDMITGQFKKELFTPKDADVLRIMTSSNAWAGEDKLVAAVYSGAKRERHWFDMEEKALYEGLEAKIPHAHEVSIGSRSRDGNTMVVFNSGPKDPGSYYLVRGGRMSKLGSRNPLVKPSDLSDVEYIRYPARDGKMIPGYVTKPKGPGPHPLIVLPHGGPHVNEVIGYDEWGQLLANNGYMVLQPQYRMSVGWGQEHFDSAMGQHGLAMQDDKDDGAKYLVSKGWADPDRMAMFGWSYGGYAALVAASRPDNLYQCTIAGAAVADAKKVYLKRSGGSSPKPIDEWARARGGFVGINPIEEVDKVNIPVLMVHGDVDARVLYFNYEDYKKKMEEAGKEAQFLTLKGADHFSRTLMYNHQEEFYTKMLDFLENDCGPGGL